MYINSYKLIFTSALLLATLSTSGNALAVDKLSQDLSNVRLETQIWTTYALSPYLRANKLKVSVKDGVATISGVVAEDVDRDLAKQVALGVSGIDKVDNQITVNPDYKPEKDIARDRSYGQIIDDASTTAVVKSKLLWSKNSSAMSTNVDTQFGKVTLSGTAETAAAKELAGRLAKNTQGVVSVDNLLAVGKGKKSETMVGASKSDSDIGDKVSDSWITTKVKSTYIYSSNVDSSDISVSTSDGLVTLTGKVGSGAERELAIELAQNIRGVKSVQPSALTY